MVNLYQYRVQKPEKHLPNLPQTIKDGKPEMQLKEIINFIVKQLLTYNYFHGFVTQELRHDDRVKYIVRVLSNFCKGFRRCNSKRNCNRSFKRAAKSEDIVSMLLGTVVFTIRNKNFYEIYLKGNEDFLLNLKKLKKSSQFECFALLGYQI